MIIIKKNSFIHVKLNFNILKFYYINTILLFICCQQTSQQQQDLQFQLKTDPFTLDLYHKFASDQEFKLRGTLLIKPRSEYRVAQASIIKQAELSEQDIETLKKSSEQGDIYYLKTSLRGKNNDKNFEELYIKTTQTIVKSCSLYSSNLVDNILINLSPINEFLSVNLYTNDPECRSQIPHQLSNQFNTTILIDSGLIGPSPETATYIKRLEEERQNKAKEGKEDNRSFFAKYWVYIVPAVIILMMFSGPPEGGR